jgi:hypothetical protein
VNCSQISIFAAACDDILLKIKFLSMKNFKISVILLVFSLFFNKKTTCQQTFQAGLVAGLTAAQLDGDDAYGYNQPGLQAGGRVGFFIREKQQLTLEMTFSQRGARLVGNPELGAGGFTVRTNYIDIPVQWHYNDWVAGDDGEEYFKVSGNVGIYYGRLLNWKTDCTLPPCDFLDKRLELANENDLGFLLGGTFFANRHWGFTLRYQSSFNYLFNPEKHSDAVGNPLVNAKALRSHFLTLQSMYMF